MGLAFEIEEAMYEADVLQSTLSAVWTAMYEGTTDFREYESALHGCWRKACDLKKSLDALTNEAYELQRAGKAGGNDAKG